MNEGGVTSKGARSIFVTGGAGFIGSHLLRLAVSRGMDVRALWHQRPITVPGVEVVRGDLLEPAPWLEALAGVDAVIHCAAALDPVESEAVADRLNHQATVHLAQIAADAGVPVMVFVSSIAAIGFRFDAGLMPVDAPCAPTTAYGRSKRAAEEALLGRIAAGRIPGEMRLVVVRPPTVYGEGERMNFLALTRAIDRRAFLVPGRGDNRTSFCYVGNLAEGLLWAAETDGVRGVMHIADDRPVTLREAAETIAAALGRGLLPLPFPMPIARALALVIDRVFRSLGRPPPLSPARLNTLTADCALDTRATEALGFRPSTNFTDGVRRTIAEYRDAGVLDHGRA